MLIHVNVDEDVYKYLSKRAEELEKSVGQFSSECLTIWSGEEEMPVDVITTHEQIVATQKNNIDILREANIRLLAQLEELRTTDKVEPEDADPEEEPEEVEPE